MIDSKTRTRFGVLTAMVAASALLVPAFSAFGAASTAPQPDSGEGGFAVAATTTTRTTTTRTTTRTSTKTSTRTSTKTSTRTTTTSSLPGTTVTTTPGPAHGKPDGYAALNTLGQNGTTGGLGGPVITTTTADQFLDAIDTVGPLIIQVQGTITISSKQGVRPNKTIVGVGGNAEITGGGLDFYKSYNVIVRNLKFSNAEDDSVNVGQNSHHIWIDHNTFTQAADGSIDIVRGADYVTVSWNHFDHTDKSMLLGHSDSNASEDTGHLKVSIHHNWFDGSGQRHPRVRFGEPVHVYNNYYSNIALYGVAAVMNAGVLVEGNYFENVAYPVYSTSGYADSGPGRAVVRDNVFVNSGSAEANGAVAEPSSYYGYTLDDPNTVPAKVRAGAGSGVLS
jgi:pectate lyase